MSCTYGLAVFINEVILAHHRFPVIANMHVIIAKYLQLKAKFYFKVKFLLQLQSQLLLSLKAPS